MKLKHDFIKELCKSKGIQLTELLKLASVSSTAYYSLLKKKSIVPKSLNKISSLLNVPASFLIHDEQETLKNHLELLEEVNEIINLKPHLDPNEVRHVLILLKEPALTRLQRGLQRGRLITSGG